jgi:cobalt-precorrin 5A hydrolase
MKNLNRENGRASVAMRRPYAIYAITRHGIAIGEKLRSQLPEADLYVSEKLLPHAAPGALPLALPMGPALADLFTGYDCHVFIVSVGAVVRMIAPLLKDKKVDPAVVCVDDAAKFSICVLSGHVGRGNVFTERVANALGAQAVVTTASDVLGTLTVDILGRDLGWSLDDPDRNVTRGCAAVVNAAPVLFVQETGESEWWPAEKPLPPGVRYGISLDDADAHPDNFEIFLVATDREIHRTHPNHWAKAVIYRPKSLVLGLGCDRGIAPDVVERGVQKLFEQHGLSINSVKEIATIDKKRDEAAFLYLSERYGWPLRTFTPEELDGVAEMESPSEIVKRHVGTRGVAEPAALLAAVSRRLLVPKQIYTEPGAGRSMTAAVARIPFTARASRNVGGAQEAKHA